MPTASDAGTPDAGAPRSDAGLDAGPVDAGRPADGGSIVIGVGYATRRVWTADGLTWSEAAVFTDKPPEWTNEPALPVDGDNVWMLRGACFGAGRFLGVGVGLLLTSTDGRSWTRPPTGSGKTLCAFGNGVFSTGYEVSADGLTWRDATSPPAELRAIAFDQGRFFTAGDQSPGSVFSSVDGSRFTRLAPAGSTERYTTLVAGGGEVVAFAQHRDDGALFEWNGSTASERSRTAALGRRVVVLSGAFANGQFWLFGWDDVFTRAPGSATWTRHARTGPAQPDRQVVYAFGRFITTSAWSPDGLDWRPALRPVAGGPSIEALAVGTW